MAEREVVWKALADFSSIVREAQKARKALAELDAAQGVQTSTAATVAHTKQAKALGDVQKAATQTVTAEKELNKTQVEAEKVSRSKVASVKQEITASKQRVAAMKDEALAAEKTLQHQKASTSILGSIAARTQAASRAQEDFVKSMKATGITTDGLKARQGGYNDMLEQSTEKLKDAESRLLQYRKAMAGNDRMFTVGRIHLHDQVKATDALRKANARNTTATVAAQKAETDLGEAQNRANQFIQHSEALAKKAESAKRSLTKAERELARASAEHTIALRNQDQAQLSLTNALKEHAPQVERAQAAEAKLAQASKEANTAARAQSAAQTSLDRVMKKRSATADEISAAEARLAQATSAHTSAAHSQEQAQLNLTSAMKDHSVSANAVRAAEEELAKVEVGHALATEKLTTAQQTHIKVINDKNLVERQHTAVLKEASNQVNKAEAATRKLGAARQAQAVATAAITATYERFNNTIGESLVNTGKKWTAMGGGLRWAALGLGIFGGLVPLVISALGQLASMLTAVGVGFMGMVGTVLSASGVLGALPGILIAAGASVGVLVAGFQRSVSALKLYTAAQKSAAGATTNTAKTARTNARTIRDAEASVTNAQKQASKAQDALTKARADAAQQIVDLRKQIKQLTLDEESSSQSVEQARLTLQQTLNDPLSTDLERRQAELAVREAEARLSDVHDQQQAAQTQQAQLQKQGIEGSDGVVAALEAQQSAMDAVVKAQENLADSLANIADGSATGAAALNQYDAAMAKMTPEARAVTLQLIAMGGGLRGIQATAERGFMPGVLGFLKNLQSAFPIVDRFVGAVAAIGGDMFSRMGKALGSKNGLGALQTIFTNTLPVVQSFANIFYNLFGAFKNIAIAGGPLTKWLTSTVEGWTAMWAAATGGTANQARLATFFDGARNSISLVGTALGNLLVNFGVIAKSLQPLGDIIWKAIGDTAKRWTDFNRSLEGQNALKKWGDVALPVLTQLWGILGDIGSGMMNIFALDDISGFLKVVRSDLGPALGDMFKSFTGPQGQTIAKSIAHIVEGLARLFGNKDFTSGVADIFKVVGDSLNWLGTAGGFATPLLLKFVAGLVLFKASAKVFGPALTGLGGIINFFKKDLGDGTTAFMNFQSKVNGSKFGPAVSAIGDFTSGIVGRVKFMAASAVGSFNAILTGFTNWVTGIGKGGPRLIDSLTNTYKDYKVKTDALAAQTESSMGRVSTGWKSTAGKIVGAAAQMAVAIGVAVIALKGVESLSSVGSSANASVADLALQLKGLSSSTDVAAASLAKMDEMWKSDKTFLFGDDWDGVKNLKEAFQYTAKGQWFTGIEQFLHATTGFTGTTESIRQNMSKLDQALTSMAPEDAAKAFSQLRDQAIAEGVPIEKLVELFPEYTKKLQEAATQQGISVSSTQILSGKYTDLSGEANKLAQKQRDVATATKDASDAALAAIDADVNYQQSLQDSKDAAAKAAKEKTKGLDSTTQAGRDNLKVINSLAVAGKEAVKADAAQGAGSEALKTKMAAIREAWIQQRMAFDNTSKSAEEARAKAEAAATAAGLVPGSIPVSIEVSDAEAKKKVSDFAIQLATLTPAQQATINLILQRDGYDAAQAALNAELAKPKTQYVDIVYTASADYGPGSAGYEIGRKQADGSILNYYADGGMEDHVAQIAPAGAWRVWAEPETGGESYIPLAPEKRARSISIWKQTGKILGQFANGAILKFAQGGINGGSAASPSHTAGGSFATVDGQFTALSASVTGTWSRMWDTVFARLSTAFSQITGLSTGFINSMLGDFTGMFTGLTNMFTGFRVTASTVFNSVFDAVRSPISAIITKVINPFIAGFNALASAIPGVPKMGSVADLPARATGGMIHGPGTPTSDSILGIDARGVPTARVSRNEYVVNAKSTQKYRALIEAINADRLPGHATGGLVSYKGGTFTNEFAKRLAYAEKLANENFHVSQGGFRPPTSYSGTSHAGDAVDITSPVNNVTVIALRSTGIAAWDRTGKGNWAPHIHGVPLPGAGSGGGSAVWQAQDYLKGGDGLGGKDNGPRVPVSSNLPLSLPSGGGGGGIFGYVLDSIFKPFAAVKDIGSAFMNSPMGQMASGMLNTLRDGVSRNLNSWFGFELPMTSAPDTNYGTEGIPVAVSTSGRDGLSHPSAFAQGGLVRDAARNRRGYARGTSKATPGFRWAGEYGPELIHFSGGESVHTTQELAGGGIVLAGDSSAYRMPVYMSALQNMASSTTPSKSILAIQKMLALFDPLLYSGAQDGLYTSLLGAAIQTIQKKIGISGASGNLSVEEIQRLATATGSALTIYTGDSDPANDVITKPDQPKPVTGAYTGFFRGADAAIYGMLPDGSTKYMTPAEWASLGQPFDKIFSDAYGNAKNPELASALTEQMRANALTTEFNSYQDTFASWGLDYLVENFKNKGASESLTQMRQFVQSRSSAVTFDALLKASGLELPGGSANDTAAKRQLFIQAIANGTDVGLQGASKAAGVSLDTGASFFDAISSEGGWGSISMAKLQRVVKDVNDFKQLFKFARFADGGMIGGSGSGDTTPIMATPGEFMLRKAAAEQLGPEVLNYLNHFDKMPKFSIGGFVGPYAAPSTMGYVGATAAIGRSADTNVNGKGGASGPSFHFEINNPVAEKSSVSTQKAILKLGRRGLLEVGN